MFFRATHAHPLLKSQIIIFFYRLYLLDHHNHFYLDIVSINLCTLLFGCHMPTNFFLSSRVIGRHRKRWCTSLVYIITFNFFKPFLPDLSLGSLLFGYGLYSFTYLYFIRGARVHQLLPWFILKPHLIERDIALVPFITSYV